MGYYIRVLSPSDRRIPYGELRDAVNAEHPAAALSVEQGSETEWEQLLLRHQNGTAIALVERNPSDDGLGAEELEEFRDEIEGCQPRSAATWLNDYFSRVRVIYAFQILEGADVDGGWDIVGALKGAIWRVVNGIFQADAEGFSNEDGYHILWQFSDAVSGDWWMGVLKEGAWVHFRMDLADRQQRESFLSGEVPSGAVRA